MIEALPNTPRLDGSSMGRYGRLRRERPFRRRYKFVMNEEKFLDRTHRVRQALRLKRQRIEAMSLLEQVRDMRAENPEPDQAQGTDGTDNRLVATSSRGKGTIVFVPVDGLPQIPLELS